MFKCLLFCFVLLFSFYGSANSYAVQEEATAKKANINIESPSRIVAIGDLHGSLSAARKALALAGAIDQNDHWIGGDLVVVQLGDLVDRGENDRSVIDLMEALKKEAKQAGGQLITLLGNHELMNVCGDYRYVSKEGMKEFKDFSKNGTPHDGRFQAFKPGGAYARILADNPVVLAVGDTLFVHAGLTKSFSDLGIEKINQEAHKFLKGELKNPPQFIIDSDGPLWARRYTQSPSQEDCQELSEILKKFNCKRMVVGHTIQYQGISSTCDNQCWMVDTGMAFSSGKVEVLEIKPSGLAILKAERD